ncbi:hypothetical protein GCM10010372_75530 [Streptomyces tauricus]|nr:hypothetical protein GCM10010372_75530 [Streptomyces tauricus]
MAGAGAGGAVAVRGGGVPPPPPLPAPTPGSPPPNPRIALSALVLKRRTGWFSARPAFEDNGGEGAQPPCSDGKGRGGGGEKTYSTTSSTGTFPRVAFEYGHTW